MNVDHFIFHGAVVHSGLGSGNGRRGLDSHPKGNGHTGGDAAQNAPVVIGMGLDVTVLVHIKFIVVLTAHHFSGQEACAKFDALYRRNAEY